MDMPNNPLFQVRSICLNAEDGKSLEKEKHPRSTAVEDRGVFVLDKQLVRSGGSTRGSSSGGGSGG
jgi:hypothetical protein